MSNTRYNFKVDNPTLDNEIIQMRSEHLQPPIHWGELRYFLDKPNDKNTEYRSSKIKISNLRK